MPRRREGGLQRSEVALIKAMIARGGYRDQDILAYFTRPSRTINHARIADIRHGRKHRNINRASDESLDEYLSIWPLSMADSGLNPESDELVIKAREAMIAAVHTFNGAGLTFRAELFIVTAVIAWTYLLHAWFRKNGIEYRYVEHGVVQTTREGAEKYLELGACLRHADSPVPDGVKTNLEVLLEIRHEIEHRHTNRIDDALSAKLQACCINFNNSIKKWFGAHCGLERRLPIALQFVTFSSDQRSLLKKVSSLPQHIASSIDAYEEGLTEEQYKDPAYRFNVAFVPIVKQRASAADSAVEFVPRGSEEAENVNRILLKEVERSRFTATQVVELMRQSGFPNFGIGDHTRLWQELDGKNPAKGYGRVGDYQNSWVWFEPWTKRVQAHCEEKGDRYR